MTSEDTLCTQTRNEWKKFIKIWTEESQLFHCDFPKSQNQAYYDLRIKKLGIHIYEYLHEKSNYHQMVRNENVDKDPTTWMIGGWFPSTYQADPASSMTKNLTNTFFPR